MEKSKKLIIKQLYPNRTLVRRARLIRRRTTTQYCERLKQLKEKEDGYINQILIIRLKQRSKATDYELACVNNSTAEMVPCVDFAYPPLGSNTAQFPPPLFYPDFMKNSVQRKEDLEAFSVVLTNEKGDRTFAYCFKFLSANKKRFSLLDDERMGDYSVLVFASHYSLESRFHRLAADVVANIQRGPVKMQKMCRDLLSLRFSNSDESVRYAKYVVADTSDGDSDDGQASTSAYNFASLTSTVSKWTRSAVSTTTLQKFGVENTVFVFLSLLAEKRIIVTGANVSDVSRAVQSFVRLLAPLEWPHTLIPIVPDSQTELCYNPTPFICGVLRYNLNRIKDLLCPLPEDCQEETVVVDIERGVILPSLSQFRTDAKSEDNNTKPFINYAAVMGFPKSVTAELISSLKTLLPIKSPSNADRKLQKRIMIFYAKLFGHFQRFGVDILTARNRKRFVQAHPCADTRFFLKWFVENGILQSFIFNQKAEAYRNHELDLRFQEILRKYSPPVDKQGKRRKAKSIMWKIFTR